MYFLLDPLLGLTPHKSGYVLTVAYLKLKMWLADQTQNISYFVRYPWILISCLYFPNFY